MVSISSSRKEKAREVDIESNLTIFVKKGGLFQSYIVNELIYQIIGTYNQERATHAEEQAECVVKIAPVLFGGFAHLQRRPLTLVSLQNKYC